MLKTGTYFWVHLVVALSVAYAVTGSWAAATAIGLLEPAVQVLAYALHESLWARRCAGHGRAVGRLRRWLCGLKAFSYFWMHVVVAMTVVYTVTGNVFAAMSVGLIEPAVQVLAYHLHERAWRRASIRRAGGVARHRPAAMDAHGIRGA